MMVRDYQVPLLFLYCLFNVHCVTGAADCGPVPCVKNGEYTLDIAGQTQLGSTATLECSDGYYTNDSVTITCEYTAQGWSDPDELCLLDCPSAEWVQFGTSCYLFGSDEFFYSEAREFCNQFDTGIAQSSLVQVDTTEELTFLKGYMTNRILQPTRGYWNDMFKVDPSGTTFLWRTTSDVPTVYDWNGNQPDIGAANGESCVAFRVQYDYRQGDYRCANSVRPTEANKKRHFALCEIVRH